MDRPGQVVKGPAAERRRAARARSRLDVAYEDADRQVFLPAWDVSEHGIFLLAPELPPVGVSAQLVLELPGCPEILRLRGTVARQQRGARTGFALRFDQSSLPEASRRALREFVAAATGSPAPRPG